MSGQVSWGSAREYQADEWALTPGNKAKMSFTTSIRHYMEALAIQIKKKETKGKFEKKKILFIHK